MIQSAPVSFGLPFLSRVGGLERGHFVEFAGFDKDAGGALASMMALAAASNGLRVLYCSFDRSPAAVLTEISSALALRRSFQKKLNAEVEGLHDSALQRITVTGRIPPIEFSDFAVELADLEERRLEYEFEFALDGNDAVAEYRARYLSGAIADIARKLHSAGGLDLVIVESLQSIADPDSRELSATIKWFPVALKQLLRELDACGLLLDYPAIGKRGRFPTASDFIASGDDVDWAAQAFALFKLTRQRGGRSTVRFYSERPTTGSWACVVDTGTLTCRTDLGG